MKEPPPEVRRGVERVLEARGDPGTRVVESERLGGGCINPSSRLELDDGTSVFVKWSEDRPPAFFEAEARGLRALADAGPLRIPEVLGVGGTDSGAPSWLLLEFVPRGRGEGTFGPALGRDLAALHRTVGERWGWEEDNYIGSLPQANGLRDAWPGFWRDRRLLPQLERARAAGRIRGEEDRDWDRLLDRTDDLLRGAPGREGPSLLHGDLWSGNVYPGPGGEPVLVDPAVYRGHREVDLAMAELFGGFPERFFTAYGEAWPLGPGYAEVRRDLYQLYPLLVHVNLFGGGYGARAARGVRRILGAT